MKLHEDSKLIAIAGGSTAFAKLLGYEVPKGTRTVNNWRWRGIPPKVQMNNEKVMKKVRRMLARREK